MNTTQPLPVRGDVGTAAYALHLGDCLSVMRGMADDSVDSVVTDPPAGISFMGRAWDGNKGGRDQWIAWLSSVLVECRRVLKPGGHALIWALPRTSHWTGMAVEDAGFQIREVVTHLFGSGFPKSLDVSKAMDKKAGVKREVVGRYVPPQDDPKNKWTPANKHNQMNAHYEVFGAERECIRDLTAPATPEAKQWAGFGTSLKPANEHWILARKPLSESSVAANVAEWGTAALNIDACRVGNADTRGKASMSALGQGSGWNKHNNREVIAGSDSGRWPPNVVLTHSADCNGVCAEDCPIRILDLQSGNLKSNSGTPFTSNRPAGNVYGGYAPVDFQGFYGDSGGASRFYPTFRYDPEYDAPFFYCAKASRSERNEGCEALEKKAAHKMAGGEFQPDGRTLTSKGLEHQNHHPTVKPVALIRWLCRLITPPGGLILDPFMGSGTTGVAAVQEGFRFVGIEREAEYMAICEKRIEHAASQGRQTSFFEEIA